MGDPSRWACQSETTLHWSCGAGKFSSNRMLPLVPQVVAFVGPRGRLAAHLGTVSTGICPLGGRGREGHGEGGQRGAQEMADRHRDSVHHERGDRYSGEYHQPSVAQRVGQVMS